MAQSTPFSQRLMASLSKRCEDSVRRSLDHYAGDELDRFGLEAGMAVETLAKLVLFRIHPSLIVEAKPDRQFESLLLVLDQGGQFKITEDRLRTIGPAEAVQRLMRMYPDLTAYRLSLQLLVESRNGVAHVGLADVAAISGVAGDYLRALETICKCAGIETHTLFGEHIELARTLADAKVRKGQIDYAKKRSLAERRYQDRYGHLDKYLVVKAVQPQIGDAERSTNDLKRFCPVCGFLLQVIGELEVDPWEVDDYDDSGKPLNVHRSQRLASPDIKCLVCGLHLVEWTEIQAAGIDIALPDEQGTTDDLEYAIRAEMDEKWEEEEWELRQQRYEDEDWTTIPWLDDDSMESAYETGEF